MRAGLFGEKRDGTTSAQMFCDQSVGVIKVEKPSADQPGRVSARCLSAARYESNLNPAAPASFGKCAIN